MNRGKAVRIDSRLGHRTVVPGTLPVQTKRNRDA